MPEWAAILLGVGGGLVLLWLGLVVALGVAARRSGRSVDWREVARLAPDVVRLLKRLATDRSVPNGPRIVLGALLVYLLIPLDLIPDFLPVIGYADDAIIVAVALRYAVRRAGLPAIERNWPGTAAGLAALTALVGIRPDGLSRRRPPS